MGSPLYATDPYGLATTCRIEASPQTGWYLSGQTNKKTLKNQPLYVPVCKYYLPRFGTPGPDSFEPDLQTFRRNRQVLPSRSPPIPIEFSFKCKDLYYHKYILEAQELMDMAEVRVCRDDCGKIVSSDPINSYKRWRWVSRGEQWEIVSGSEYIVNE